MRAEPRLTALLAALAVLAIAAVRGRLRQQRRRAPPAAGAAAEAARRSRSAPTSPIPRSRNSARARPNSKASTSNWWKRSAKKIGRTAGIQGHLVRHDLPRPRAGQVRHGRLGDDDHRRTRGNRRLHQPLLPASAQSIVVKKGNADLKTVKDLEGKSVGVQQGTTGEEYVEEETDAERTPAPTRRAPTRSRL